MHSYSYHEEATQSSDWVAGTGWWSSSSSTSFSETATQSSSYLYSSWTEGVPSDVSTLHPESWSDSGNGTNTTTARLLYTASGFTIESYTLVRSGVESILADTAVLTGLPSDYSFRGYARLARRTESSAMTSAANIGVTWDQYNNGSAFPRSTQLATSFSISHSGESTFGPGASSRITYESSIRITHNPTQGTVNSTAYSYSGKTMEEYSGVNMAVPDEWLEDEKLYRRTITTSENPTRTDADGITTYKPTTIDDTYLSIWTRTSSSDSSTSWTTTPQWSTRIATRTQDFVATQVVSVSNSTSWGPNPNATLTARNWPVMHTVIVLDTEVGLLPGEANSHGPALVVGEAFMRTTFRGHIETWVKYSATSKLSTNTPYATVDIPGVAVDWTESNALFLQQPAGSTLTRSYDKSQSVFPNTRERSSYTQLSTQEAATATTYSQALPPYNTTMEGMDAIDVAAGKFSFGTITLTVMSTQENKTWGVTSTATVTGMIEDSRLLVLSHLEATSTVDSPVASNVHDDARTEMGFYVGGTVTLTCRGQGASQSKAGYTRTSYFDNTASYAGVTGERLHKTFSVTPALEPGEVRYPKAIGWYPGRAWVVQESNGSSRMGEGMRLEGAVDPSVHFYPAATVQFAHSNLSQYVFPEGWNSVSAESAETRYRETGAFQRRTNTDNTDNIPWELSPLVGVYPGIKYNTGITYEGAWHGGHDLFNQGESVLTAGPFKNLMIRQQGGVVVETRTIDWQETSASEQVTLVPGEGMACLSYDELTVISMSSNVAETNRFKTYLAFPLP